MKSYLDLVVVALVIAAGVLWIIWPGIAHEWAEQVVRVIGGVL